MKRILTIGFFVLIYCQMASGQPVFEVTIETVETDGKQVPCYIRVGDAKGLYHLPDSNFFWKSFMGQVLPDYPSNGTVRLRLQPGKYTCELSRGPEYERTRSEFEVTTGPLELKMVLRRMIDLSPKGWWPGDLHGHRAPDQMERLMRAGDLHVAPVITSWNDHYPDTGSMKPYIRHFDDNRFLSLSGSEDERFGGALLYLNTGAPLNFNRKLKMNDPVMSWMVDSIHRALQGKVWIDLEKPFWKDLPLLLPDNKINSIGIAHNHMNLEGVFDTEGWGRPRDKTNYPSPFGNAYYTQDVYYHILNCGFRIPPSAGSASGVLPNPVGYNRVYAYVDGALSYENWFEAVARGNTFVTNGPLLLTHINGKKPGEIFKADRPLKVELSVDLNNHDTTRAIQIVYNGKIINTVSVGKTGKFDLRTTVDVPASGWIIIRAISDLHNNFRFASTAPYYFEIGKKKHTVSRASAQYFMDWTRERRSELEKLPADERVTAGAYIDRAEKFWKKKLKKANAE